MPFPDEDLDVRVQAAFGADLSQPPTAWAWTDLTSRLLPTTIPVTTGTAVGAASAQVSRATVQLRNDDGALTPLRATSPYWPYVDAGTPARVSINPKRFTLTDTFTRTVTGGWGTPPTGTGWTIFGTASEFAVTGSAATMTPSTRGGNLWAFAAFGTTYPRHVDMLFDAAVSAVATGVALLVGPVLRYVSFSDFLWCTVEFGLAGVVQLKVRANRAGVESTLAQLTVPAMTYTAGTSIRTRVQVVGDRLRMRAWLPADPEPATWLVDVYNGYVTDSGLAAIRAYVYAGNTNTLPLTFTIDNVTIVEAPAPVIEGYISDIRPTFQPIGGGATWSEVALDVSGVSSRLEKNQSPSFSPMRRSIQLADIKPIAYWPLEDGDGATYGVSAFPAGPRMVVEPPLTFGFAAGIPTDLYLSRYGTKPLVSVATGGRLTGLVPQSAVATEWNVDVTSQSYVLDVPGITEMRIIEWYTVGGTHNRWALVSTSAGYQVRAYNDLGGTTTTVVTMTLGVYDQLIVYEVDATQNGANIDVNLYVNSGSVATGSTAGTLGPVVKVVVNPDKVNTTNSVTPRGLRFIVGHVRVSDNTDGVGLPFYYDLAVLTTDAIRADQAWYREAAHRRLQRLCAEEGVPFSVRGFPYTTGITQLGAQADGTFTELIRAATEAESGGVLYEHGFGYAYLPRSVRYGQAPTMTIDLATYAHGDDTNPTDVLVPQLDTRMATVWTVQRTGGAAGSYAAPAAYRQRRGTIGEQVTLDLLRDEDTDQHAAWRVHQGVDAADAYYPNITVDLAANPALIDTWQGVEIGSRIVRINQPTIAGYGTVDQVADGITVELGPRTWRAVVNASPAQVWDVARADDTVLGKADTDGSTTRSTAASSTTVLVDVTAGPQWTTDPAQMPILVSAAGEDMRVTAISGTSNPQTFTVVRALNGVSKALPAGTPISLTNPARAAL